MARLPSSTAEQRSEYLQDVFKLISPGFLSERVVVNGVNVCIRSPFPSDYDLLDFAYESGSDAWTLALVSRLTWMVDGYVLFGDVNAQGEIRSLYSSLPPNVFNTLYHIALALVRRMVRARTDVVFYMYEDQSRDLWRGLGKQAPNFDRLTGFKGLEGLGLNSTQKIWVAWNTAEDQRQHDEFVWTCTKQSMAPHAPKAIEKMNKQEKQREETRLRDRQKAQDEWYYKKKGVLNEEGKLVTSDDGVISPFEGDQVSMSYTSEELADEMRRWVSGDLDWHDTVVKRYKDQIRENMLQERAEREARLAEAAREIQEREENLGIRARDRLVGYTAAQINQMMRDSGRDLENPGARTISYAPSRKQTAFDKWVDGEVDSGALILEDGKLVPKKEIPKPLKDERSLQSKINSRLPRYDGGTE